MNSSKIKILQIVNQAKIGGAEKLVMDLSKSFNEMNMKADIFFLKKIPSPFFDLSDERNFGKIYFGNSYSIYNPIIYFRLIKLIREYNIVNVHLFPSLYLIPLLKLFAGKKVKFVYTEHSTTNRRRKTRFLKILDNFVYRKYDLIISITSKVLENLLMHVQELGKKSLVISNGVDIKKIEAIKALNLTEYIPGFKKNDFIITQVSSFIYPKDQITLITALNKLSYNYKLVLVGEGVLMENAKKVAQNLGLNDRVVFLGNRADAVEIMKSSNILVLSSGYEGLSMFCLEAFAASVPLIASDVNGIRDLVLNNGILFEHGNSQELAHCIEHLANNPLLYHEITERSKKFVQCYSLQKTAESYLNVYRTLLNNID